MPGVSARHLPHKHLRFLKDVVVVVVVFLPLLPSEHGNNTQEKHGAPNLPRAPPMQASFQSPLSFQVR